MAMSTPQNGERGVNKAVAQREVTPGVTEVSSTAWTRRCLRSFRVVDDSGDGTISNDELRTALQRSGVVLEEHEIGQLVRDVDQNNDNVISFQEFCELAKRLRDMALKQKSKSGRIPRLYLSPEQYDQYAALFRTQAGEEGLLNTEQLAEFFATYNIHVPADRLSGIMAEVDDDASGSLDETEFMVLLIKAMGLKRRRVGPGLSDLAQLRDEAWALVEMRRLGYEYKHFVEAGYDLASLMDIFSPSELRRAGVELAHILAKGWDCSKAREQGFTLQELHKAGVSIKQLRAAGFDDAISAVQLRTLGIAPKAMQAGGWPASLLRNAGYSASEMRLAGFSSATLVHLRQAAMKEDDSDNPELVSTPRVRAHCTAQIAKLAEAQKLTERQSGV